MGAPVFLVGSQFASADPNSDYEINAAQQDIAELSFGERVECQKAIEEVYWQHRIWPDVNPGSKPQLADVMPQSDIEAKVEEYLRKGTALGQLWHRPVTASQLQAELDRIVERSQNKEMLRELFDVLGHDPTLIAECLARPVLVDRLIRNWYSSDDRFHGDLRRTAFEDANLRSLLTGSEATQTEVELVLSRDAYGLRESTGLGTVNSEELDQAGWDKWTAKLERAFGTGEAPPPNHLIVSDTGSISGRLARLPLNELSSPLEDRDGFTSFLVKSASSRRLRLGIVRWYKRSFEEWWQEVRTQFIPSIEVSPSMEEYYIDGPLGADCEIGTWRDIEDEDWFVGLNRVIAVWTGAEMIVWGHVINPDFRAYRYDPAIDVWSSASEGAVPVGAAAAGVWTGTEMIVFGGGDNGGAPTNEGGRFDPTVGVWVPTSTVGAAPRLAHTAVWTGTEMIVWGGNNGADQLDTGGRYNPVTNSWTVTSAASAPDPRQSHSSVWTGSEMLIWGGDSDIGYYNNGGRYNPNTDSWAPITTSNAPTPRSGAGGAWVGNRAFFWGGVNAIAGVSLDSGGLYNPATNSWTPTSMNLVPNPRFAHSTIWTGSRVIVWGGYDLATGDRLATGGMYNPTTDSWLPTSLVNAPEERDSHGAVWTETEMIVWGGQAPTYRPETGGRFNPNTSLWVSTPTIDEGPPSERYDHGAVSTGAEMVIWGGLTGSAPRDTGGVYDQALDAWSPTSMTAAPEARSSPSLIWTGTEMIVWGGKGATNCLTEGGRYSIGSDSWGSINEVGSAEALCDTTAVWTGTEMLAWGGRNQSGQTVGTGAAYDPSLDSWRGLTTTDAPSARHSHSAVWTGQDMVIWGGFPNIGDGAKYDPTTDTWGAVSVVGSPAGRDSAEAVWTGSEMLIWGGRSSGVWVSNGGLYDPTTDTWNSASSQHAPTARRRTASTWSGKEFIIWGGCPATCSGPIDTGSRYDPSLDQWFEMTTTGAPSARANHSIVVTGDEALVWGGAWATSLNSGGAYCLDTRPGPLASDLELTSSAPFCSQFGGTVSFSHAVTNLGPDFASGSELIFQADPSTLFTSVMTTAGSCDAPSPGNPGDVTCSLGTIDMGDSVTVVIEYLPTAMNTLVSTSSVSANEPDPGSENNESLLRTVVFSIGGDFCDHFASGDTSVWSVTVP